MLTTDIYKHLYVMSISFMLEIVLKFMCRNILLIDKVATNVVYEVYRVI